ncbi:DUF3267 domain-containing protein [Chitinophaga alhagiae]|nr:DUF3267 domain-containing protein [Chitinophaga alhagiae]
MMEGLVRTMKEKGYEPLAQYGFRELVIPLREGLQTSNIYTLLFWLFFFLGCGLAGLFVGFTIGSGALPVGALCGWLLLGIPATFLLVPLHEMLHGLMFRGFGAKDVRYGVIWRYLMFYAVAHAYVVNYRQFRYIALAPFVVISLLCAVVFPFVPVAWQALLIGLYCFHTLCCAGDFGLCAYFYKYRHRNPVSFDDADNGISYFYALPDPPHTENA